MKKNEKKLREKTMYIKTQAKELENWLRMVVCVCVCALV